MRGMQESMRIRAAGMGRVGEWACLLLCFFMLSRPTPGRAQEADDTLPADDAPFAEDGLSDEDDPALAAMAEAGAEECVPVGADDLIELNFEGADIREVIQGLAAGLCIHYSIDPRVQGAVTLRTASKIRGQDLFPLFHQIMRINGIAAVKVGDIYHIAPVGEAKTKVPLLSESSGRRTTASAQDEFVIELIKLEHIAATAMTEILQPFVSPGGDVVAYPRGNLVILTDLASNVERLRDLIAAFDTDTFRTLHTQIYRIEHANVEDLGKELASILQPYGVIPENAEERGLYIIPLTRLNAIVVFGFNEEIFSQIEKWIRVLDVPPEKGGGRTVYVYAVENSKAADLAGVLGDLYGGGGGGRGTGRDREGGQGANQSDSDSGTGLGGGGGLGGRGSRRGGGSSVLIEPVEGETPLFKEVVRIVADEISNSLIILATPRDYDKIREVLVRIDVVPRQVLIEAIIAEISLTGNLEFGIEYAFATGGIENILGTTGGGGSSNSLLQTGAKKAVNVSQNGIFSFITDQDNFISMINAINTRSRVNVLATPHVIAADNREAHILIGTEVPILTSTQQSTLATANIVSSIQYRDTGTILTILPQVNSAGLVNMEIRQEVSNVGVASFGDTNSPSFTSRETETTVVVRNRESVLIGGIIDERIERSRNGVPFLMDVPVLGRLFRVEQDKRERTELVILITPYVIRDRNEAQVVTKEFTQRVHRLREMIESASPSADRKPDAADEE